MSVSRVILKFSSSLILASFVFASMPSAQTNTALELTQSARNAFSQGDAQAAYGLLTQAIKSEQLSPDILAETYLNRALVAQKLAQTDAAIEDYTAALDINYMPSKMRAKTFQSRGLLRIKAGKFGPATEDFTKSLLLDSKNPQAYFGRAHALHESGQYLFALSDYDRALSNGYAEKAKIHFAKALTYEALQQSDNQQIALNAALSADANFKPAMEKLATLQMQAPENLPDPIVSDAILTASTSTNPMAETKVMKKTLPKAIEPPAALLADNQIGTEDTPVEFDIASAQVPLQPVEDADAVSPVEIAAVETPVVIEQPVQVVADASVPEISPPVADDEKRVDIASVPSVPPQAPATTLQANTQANSQANTKVTKTQKKAKTIAPVEADPVQVGSTGTVNLSKHKGWVVQLASAPAEDGAWRLWNKMLGKVGALKKQDAVVVRADLGAKGIFYRLRLVGFDDQAGAAQTCTTLKSAGVACYVSNTNG